MQYQRNWLVSLINELHYRQYELKYSAKKIPC